MFLSSLKLGRSSRSGRNRARRPLLFRTTVEAVEGRMLLSTMSAISWNSGGVEHSEVFSIGVDNEVWGDKDGTGLVDLTGYVTQISAGLDNSGNPELYGIGGNNAVWVNHLNGGGWSSVGGDVLAISASNLNTVFAIGTNNAVFVDYGSGWNSLGGDMTQISAGETWSGVPEVFSIGANSQAYVNQLTSIGWIGLGGDYTSLSATSDNTVFAVGTNNSVYVDYGYGFYNEGGYVLQITAGTDTYGFPEVFGIGGNNAAYVNDDGRGWVDMGGYVSDLAASTDNAFFARGEIVSQIFSDTGSGYNYLGDMPIVEPGAGASYSPASASIKLYSNGTTGQPSYLDVDQGTTGDCWLLASLAEVAVRDPQDIKNMFSNFTYTLAANGALIWNYEVQFYKANGSPFDVEVDSQFPVGGVGDNLTNDLGTSSLWVALAEKAYVEANALGFVGSESENNGTYAALDEGYASDALHAITDKAATWAGTNPTTIAADWLAGDLIVLGTGTKANAPVSSYIVGNHAYAVIGYNASSTQPFSVFNPWGTDSSGYAPGHSGTIYGQFTATGGFLTQNFIGQYVGNGASNVADITRAVDEVIGSASPGFGGGGGAGKVAQTAPAVEVTSEATGMHLDTVNQAEETSSDSDSSESLDLAGKKVVTLGASKPIRTKGFGVPAKQLVFTTEWL